MDDKESCNSWNGIDSGEEIVISGISGRFPDSDNMNQLQKNLFNKRELIRADHGRWRTEHPDLPRRMGVINNTRKFDADFFDFPFEQAQIFLPEIKILLEHSYEAIIDAGINPKQLRGKNTAVIIGNSLCETQLNLMYTDLKLNGLNVTGCSKSSLANMISHHFDLKGPSQIVDTACSSSLYAINIGYRYIMSGQCEDAIIGAAQININSIINMHFFRFGTFTDINFIIH
ncbi:PREDICTED: fatty acid synthase-like [Vollenhovia emeryi]|uniref:fatty acid synthase-like n=1 Tax=Vollenhovia emeryi TaxID=411798 RepID=UPI0005F3A734|nr:PREDICTED: fatty acid synthase-like [Vollenhovia emeryi]